MQVEIILTVKEMNADDLTKKTVVVIDTLRATSTIVTALANGALGVEPMVEIIDAQQRGDELAAGTYLLCGEREGQKIRDFDLGNSPLDYLPEVVRQRQVILSTTNGTLAITRASVAKRVLIAALLNKTATMDEVIKSGDDLVLSCSGTKGAFSLEDFVTAGAMIADLKRRGITVTGDDRILAAYLLYDKYRHNLVEILRSSQNGQRLIELGRGADIQFCSREDVFFVVCRYADKIIRI